MIDISNIKPGDKVTVEAEKIDAVERYLLDLLPDLVEIGEPATSLKPYIVGSFRRLRADLRHYQEPTP